MEPKGSQRISGGKVKVGLSLMTLLFMSLCLRTPGAEPDPWRKLDDGLYMGEFGPREKSGIWTPKIAILKIDPSLYTFRLLSASEHNLRARTPKEWCAEFGLVAVINASMYQSKDPLKSTGYMKNYEHFNNSRFNSRFGALMVFNPIDHSLPEVQIVDRTRQKNWRNLIEKYNTVVQNYRMITHGEKIGWPQQTKKYRMAAIGTDRENHVLFILSRASYSTHDLIQILLSLPIHLENAMYVEGGPQATLYFQREDQEMRWTRVNETDPAEYESDERASAIPNMIGIVKWRKGEKNNSSVP